MEKLLINWRKLVAPVLLVLFLILVPTWGGAYVMGALTLIGIYSIIAIGICLLMGYAGQVSLGQTAFYGIGAYTSSVLAIRYDLSPWLGVIVGAVLAGIIAYIIGRPLLRLPGHMLAVATIAVSMIFYVLFVELDFITGGFQGLPGIPEFSIGNFVFIGDVSNYYLVWVVVFIVLIITANLVNSKTGRALRSLHRFFGGSETAAQTLGVHAAQLKALVFVIAAVYAAIAGSLYAHWITFISPSVFETWLSLMVILMAVVGGMGSLWGAVIGATFYVGMKEIITMITEKVAPGATAEYEVMAFAIIFLVMLRFAPKGFVQLPSVVRERLRASARPVQE